MAWRPRKSFRIGKGFRINLSKRGLGWSGGLPGIFRFGVGADGRRRGSLGRGIFRQEKQWGKSSSKDGESGCCGCISVGAIAFILIAVVFSFFVPNNESIDSESMESESLPYSPPISPELGVNTLSMTPENSESMHSDQIKPVKLPTSIRTWRSLDGRTLFGKVTEINLDEETITIERADGEKFEAYPISKLHPDDAKILFPMHHHNQPKGK